MSIGFKLLASILPVLLSVNAAADSGVLSADVPVSSLWVSPDTRSLGFDQAGLDAIVSFHQQKVAEGSIPGAAMLVARKGEVIFEAAVGYADKEAQRPLAMDHLFRIYSMTKPIVAAAAFQQIEQGLYELDTPISGFVPEYSNMKVGSNFKAGGYDTRQAHTPITVRHLLTHTAGFLSSWGGGPLAELYERDGVYEGIPASLDDRSVLPKDLSEFSTRLAKLPLLHEPGAKFTYGVSSDVMGRVTEVTSGDTFDRYLEREIFQTLQMNDTSFCVPSDKLSRLTTLYEYDKDAVLFAVDLPSDTVRACPVGIFSGGGGLVSTVHDYWRFAEAIRLGGALDGARILQPESAALFQVPQPFVKASESAGWMGGTEWGLSVAQVMDPSKTHWKDVEGNYYWSGAASTYFWIDPKNEMVALIFTQILRNAHPNDVKWDFRNLVYDAFVGAPYPGQ